MHAFLLAGKPIHALAQRGHRTIQTAIHTKRHIRGSLNIHISKQAVHRQVGRVSRLTDAADLQRDFKRVFFRFRQVKTIAFLQTFIECRLHSRAAGIIQNAEHAVPALLFHHPRQR